MRVVLVLSVKATSQLQLATVIEYLDLPLKLGILSLYATMQWVCE